MAQGDGVHYKEATITKAAVGGGVRLWDMHTRRLIRRFYAENNPFYRPDELKPPLLVDHLRFSPDGRQLVGVALFGGGCGEPEYMQLWSIRSGRLQTIPESPGAGDGDVCGVAFSRRGTLATSHYGGISLWNGRTGRLQRDLRGGPDCAPSGLCFSPDGRRMAGGGGAVTLWDTHTGKVVRRIDARVRGAMSLAYSPDGRTLAIGTGDGWLGLWPAP